MAETVILDSDFLRSRLDAAGILLPSLIEVFGSEVPRLIAAVERCYRSGDGDEARRYAHKLKGMCLNMGAVRLGEISRFIEEETPDDIEPHIQEALAVFQRTMDALEKMAADGVRT